MVIEGISKAMQAVTKANSLVSKEKEQVIVYGKFIQSLKEAVEEKEEKKAKLFVRRAALIERRVHRFQKDLLSYIDLIRSSPFSEDLKDDLEELENQLELYEAKLTAEDSKGMFRAKGKIPDLINKDPIDWNELKKEIEETYKEGVTPIIEVLKLIGERLDSLISKFGGGAEGGGDNEQ